MNSPRIVAIAWGIILAIIIGCGGGGAGTGGGGGGVSVSLSPSYAAPAFGQTVDLVATVSGLTNQTVSWSADGGTVSATGARTATYTAPATAGTYIVRATASDGVTVGTSTMSVAAIGVTVSPSNPSVGAGKTVSFTSAVTGTADQRVTWSTTGGTVTSTGTGTATYTAPSSPGTYFVTATSVADNTRFGRATVTVTSIGGNVARITGRISNQQTGVGVGNIDVAIYNNAGTLLTTLRSTSNGTFSGLVDISAKSMQVTTASLGNGFYKAFEYNFKRYSTLVATCRASLPTLFAGSNVTLPTDVEIIPTSSPPPPPPNGCQ
ncbi:MAG: hypothetical protein U0S12_04500 [Fimbriimonadales bacterium]